VATAETAASTTLGSARWLRRTWEKFATVLAVIGLIDLTRQLVQWAELVHWIATQYAIVRSWLFGWLPFHIPPEWHDPIALFSILLSVTNVGVYRETRRRSFADAWDDMWAKFPTGSFFSLPFTALLLFALWLAGLRLLSAIADANFGDAAPWVIWIVIFVTIYHLTFLVIFPFALFYFAERLLVAWRWLLVTATVFGALVIVNEVYVGWLEPLAIH
jgi:hypothetical protein